MPEAPAGTLLPMPVAAMVLAAGASRRLAQPKQLLRHEGETLLNRAVRLANEAGAEPVLVVLGADAERIQAAVALHKTITVFNTQWEMGMATSIHAGLHALQEIAPGVAGVLILSCDQPRLRAAHLRVLIESFAANLEPVIVASAYAGVHGVPAVFPRLVFEELFALRGDQGARALLLRPPCPLIALPFEGGEVDIDEPGDLVYLE
jgi:molybdenum cofactor cytidylyltransferase